MLLALSIAAALGQDRPNVILLTLDTTRADALSCYGRPPGPYRTEEPGTPALDALAAGGIRFENFYANAPTTLSSHATLLSGRDPHGHAVVRNGFPVSEDLPLWPERLRDLGWDTIAVMGSAALESAMGLDRGFRVYDDEAPELKGLMYQRPAEQVVAAALREVDARPDPTAPLLLWAHFYDPHTPYTPPADLLAGYADPTYRGDVVGDGPRFKALTQALRRGEADPADVQHANALYLAEVSAMDRQLGVLLDGLRQRGLLERALVIAVADHGETLADEEIYAWSHGSNVALEVMRVPLVIRGFGLPLAERAVIRRQAAMADLAPTIEALLGLQPTPGDGHPFDAWLRAGPLLDEDGWPDRPTHPVYVEASRPRQAEAKTGWNNLRMHRGVFAGGWAGWTAPFLKTALRFYDRGEAPHPEVAGLLQGLLDAWDARAPGHVEPSTAPATTRALKELGYLE